MTLYVIAAFNRWNNGVVVNEDYIPLTFICHSLRSTGFSAVHKVVFNKTSTKAESRLKIEKY